MLVCRHQPLLPVQWSNQQKLKPLKAHAKASQTIPAKSRKSQTESLRQFKMIQTLPTVKTYVYLQSENIYSESRATMTERADGRTVPVSIHPPVSQHMQTDIAHKMDKIFTTTPDQA